MRSSEMKGLTYRDRIKAEGGDGMGWILVSDGEWIKGLRCRLGGVVVERVKGGWKICYDYEDDRKFVLEKLRQAEREIGVGGEIEIVERMDERYQYGVGLNVTIACDNITGDVTEKWIEGFYARVSGRLV